MSLFSRKRGKQPAIGAQCMPVRRLSYQCAACQGVGSREYQEDAWTLVNAGDVNMIRERGLLALVADGMGGLSNGDLASRTGLQTVSEDYADMDITDDLEGQLAQSVLHACQTVYERLQGTGGSTIVACIVCNEALYYAGLGDSFLYLLRRGKLTRINREQNMLHQHYRERIRRRQMAAVSAENVSQAQALSLRVV